MRHKKNEGIRRKMKVKSIGVIILFIFTLSFSTLLAQECVNASHGNALGSGGSLSYSIGQVVYQTYTGTSGSIAEGVQQPYEISVITGIEEANGINLSFSAFPNPTTHYLSLSVDKFEISNLSYQLYDVQGNLLQNEKISSTQTRVSLSNYIPATYFLKVIRETKDVKTFKIIKK